jgi:hypothetical protein
LREKIPKAKSSQLPTVGNKKELWNRITEGNQVKLPMMMMFRMSVTEVISRLFVLWSSFIAK